MVTSSEKVGFFTSVKKIENGCWRHGAKMIRDDGKMVISCSLKNFVGLFVEVDCKNAQIELV
jgi:hypothetical protein